MGLGVDMQKKNSSTQDSCPECCTQPDSIRCFIYGGYCRTCAAFDEKAFLANWHPPAFLMHSLFGKYFKLLYRAFNRDLVMALVMCEIWQYNLGRYFDRHGQENATSSLNEADNRQRLLHPCNTYSISQVLGVPNETVRRKVKKLIERGWVENGNGELLSTKASEDFFYPVQIVEFTREFVSAARHVLAILKG